MSSPEWIDTASGVVAAAATVGAVAVAYFQLRKLVSEERRSTKINQGQVLFNLDQMYEGGAFDESRNLFADLRDHSWAVVVERYGEDNLKRLASDRSRFPVLYSACVRRIRRESPSKYQKIAKFMGFFETMGVFVADEMIEARLVLTTYDSMVWHVFELLQPHIYERRNEASLENDRYMENFETLALRAYNHLYDDCQSRQAHTRRCDERYTAYLAALNDGTIDSDVDAVLRRATPQHDNREEPQHNAEANGKTA